MSIFSLNCYNLRQPCAFVKYLSAISGNVFLNSIAKIVDWFYAAINKDKFFDIIYQI